MEFFDVYNRYGEKTGETVERSEAHRKGICHRVIHLWIVNSANQVLLQQRSATKDAGANLWYVSVGGHMESGESIEGTIVRETKEELGLDISQLTESIEYLYSFREVMREHGGAYIDDEFFDVFMLRCDVDMNAITLQKEEVQAVRYVDYAAFRERIVRRDPTIWLHQIGYKLLIAALDDALFSK